MTDHKRSFMELNSMRDESRNRNNDFRYVRIDGINLLGLQTDDKRSNDKHPISNS